MLAELRIRDFAIIEDLTLNLGPGFVVFTGETGAGKSILIDAVEVLLGGRAEATMIRSEAAAAIIEGAFRLGPGAGEAARRVLEAEGLLEDSETLMLSREIRREGRTIGRVNGRAVSVGLLRSLGELLVDVHGQSEHLSLLRVREHLNLLDRYAQVETLRRDYDAAYSDLEGVRRELRQLREAERDAARRSELLAFQVNEIEAASLRPGEEAELLEERVRLANAEQLAGLAEKALAALDETVDERSSATDLLGEAAEAVASLARIDATLSGVETEAQALLEQAGDLGRRLRVYREGIESNPKRLDEVEERIGLIRSLQRKYGETIEAVLARAAAAREELETITHAEERIGVLEKEEARRLKDLGTIGSRLSEARRAAGEELGRAIEAELGDLRMGGARFSVDLAWEDDPAGAPVGERRVSFGPEGLDRVEFLTAWSSSSPRTPARA